MLESITVDIDDFVSVPSDYFRQMFSVHIAGIVSRWICCFILLDLLSAAMKCCMNLGTFVALRFNKLRSAMTPIVVLDSCCFVREIHSLLAAGFPQKSCRRTGWVEKSKLL